VKSQRAYVQHVIECIGRIAEDSAAARDAVFASRTLQDAIVRNLQVLCESTQRIDEPPKERHPKVNWTSIAGMRNVLVHGIELTEGMMMGPAASVSAIVFHHPDCAYFTADEGESGAAA
jgi:uncharacterized protein with HEPN domain